MKIPIDNSTIGYVVRTPLTDITDVVVFKRQPEHLPTDKELITFGEFKTKYDTTHTRTMDHNEKHDQLTQELRELAKNYKFPEELREKFKCIK